MYSVFSVEILEKQEEYAKDVLLYLQILDPGKTWRKSQIVQRLRAITTALVKVSILLLRPGSIHLLKIQFFAHDAVCWLLYRKRLISRKLILPRLKALWEPSKTYPKPSTNCGEKSQKSLQYVQEIHFHSSHRCNDIIKIKALLWVSHSNWPIKTKTKNETFFKIFKQHAYIAKKVIKVYWWKYTQKRSHCI